MTTRFVYSRRAAAAGEEITPYLAMPAVGMRGRDRLAPAEAGA
jgi:hypothetical protein